MSKIKIGIDAWYLAKPYSSIGKILISTLKYWKEGKDIEFVLFGTENQYLRKYREFFKVITIPTKNLIKFYWELSKEAKKEKVDIFFFPFDIAPFYSQDYAVMVHDLRFVDLDRNVKNTIFSILVKSAAKKAKKIITPSEFTKKRVLEEYKIISRKVRMIHLGIDPIFKKIPYGEVKNKIESLNILPREVIDRGFILHVGRIKPKYKNLTILLKAYIECKDVINKALVIVSSDTPSEKDAEVISKFKEDIFLIHNVSDETLALLYNLAEFCVYPSFYEGFPVSVLESLGCGKPVISSYILPHREMVDNAGLFFDPYNVKRLKDLIIELALNESLRQKLLEKTEERAKIFSWEKFSRELLKELVS